MFSVQRPEHVRITDFGLAKLLNNKQAMFSTTGEKVMLLLSACWSGSIDNCSNSVVSFYACNTENLYDMIRYKYFNVRSKADK